MIDRFELAKRERQKERKINHNNSTACLLSPLVVLPRMSQPVLRGVDVEEWIVFMCCRGRREGRKITDRDEEQTKTCN